MISEKLQKHHPRYQKYHNDPLFHAMEERMLNLMIKGKLTDRDLNDCIDIAKEKFGRYQMEHLSDEL